MHRRLAAALASLTVAACVAAVLAAQPGASAEPGGRDGKVFNGEPASPGQLPGLVYVTDDANSVACTGTLVTPTQVLTAAHCEFEGTPLVVLGIVDLLDIETAEVHEVVSREVHPSYDPVMFTADVALLTFDDATEETPVRVVGSDEGDLYPNGTQATVAGWGLTEEGFPTVLQHGQVPVASCAFNLGPLVMCAGDGAEGHPAVCSGDSGGPLLVSGPEAEPVLVGVVTGGFAPCGGSGFPDFYAKVGHPNIREAWLEPLLVFPEPEPVDTVGPRVLSKSPTGKGVKRSTNVTVVLSEDLDPTSVGATAVRLDRMTAKGPVRVRNAKVRLLADGRTVRLDPFGATRKKLAKKARYRVTVTTRLRDLAGNALDQAPAKDGDQQVRWTFRTGKR